MVGGGSTCRNGAGKKVEGGPAFKNPLTQEAANGKGTICLKSFGVRGGAGGRLGQPREKCAPPGAEAFGHFCAVHGGARSGNPKRGAPARVKKPAFVFRGLGSGPGTQKWTALLGKRGLNVGGCLWACSLTGGNRGPKGENGVGLRRQIRFAMKEGRGPYFGQNNRGGRPGGVGGRFWFRISRPFWIDA